MQMPRFQWKIMQHIKDLEDLKLNETRQQTDANTKMAEMLELSNKYFKAAKVNMLQWAIMLKMNEKTEIKENLFNFMKKHLPKIFYSQHME